jgi:hypothetical protein
MSDDPLPTLHDKIIRAHPEMQHVAELLGSPLSGQNRKGCLRRALHAASLLHTAASSVSLTPASLLGSVGGKKTVEILILNESVLPIVERSNLSLRIGNRRFTRLTNAFSRKWENHWASVVLWYTFYNFCRIQKTLCVTPAMPAGIADHVWSVRELLEA